MKRVYLLLMVLVLLCAVACNDSKPQSNVGGSLSNPIQTEAKAREVLQAWLDNHPFDEDVAIGDSLTSEDDSGYVFTLYQDGENELAQIRVVKSNGTLLRHDPENKQNVAINGWYENLDKYNPKESADNSDPIPTSTPTQTPMPTAEQSPAEQEPADALSEAPPIEVSEVGGEADGQGGEYDDSGYSEIVGGFVTYINDGFSLSVPSDAKISSSVEKEPANQFSISEGAEVPTEKIYEIQFIYGVADVNVQVNIFPSNGAYFSTTNITVPNADGAYLHENISDSILETSKYELKVLRGDLVYILETTYNPSVALMGQAKGQTDFSYERELLKNLLDTFTTMVNSFALTDSPVSFESIANSGTYWQVNVTDLLR